MADIPAVKVGVPFGGGGIDISVLGDRELMAKLNSLASVEGKKIMRKALRESVKRLRKAVIVKVSGGFFKHPSGNLLKALKATTIKAAKRSRTGMAVIWPWPTRQTLGISPDDKFYYPRAVEHGHVRAPARSFIRSTVNENQRGEFVLIAKDIRIGVERVWTKGR